MRIALISYEYPPETGFGGIGTYTHSHARALSRLGHEVHVFAGTQLAERHTYRDGSVTVTRHRNVGFVERLLPKLDRRGLYWFKNRLQNAANSFSALRRELKNSKFDVVEMPECGGEGALINHCLDLPTVVRLHSPAELIMESYSTKRADRVLTSMVERLGMSGARVISSCSNWLAQEVRQRGLTDKPITVIPNGIDLSIFDQDEGIDIHERFGVPRDRLKIFFANRLEPRKGIHVVRDMLVPVLQRHPQVTFVLAGADPNEIVARELRPMLEKLGLADRLVHVGRIPLQEVRACLKQCDIFLLPSIWENAPYSLLEAMSAGKAIVASDCGGVPEMVRHEIDGIIAPTGDAGAFVRAIDRLQNDQLRARLGRSARARVEARFTDDLVARRSVEFYQWALGAPSGDTLSTLVRPEVALGPENWFQAWWIREAETGEPPSVGPGFQELGLDELAFVQAVAARTYWAQHGRKDAQAIAFLNELAALHRHRALLARDGSSDPAVPLVTGKLRLPALSHPLFGDDQGAEALLSELWRLGEHPLVADWLVRETDSVDFAERATRQMALRRLAVDAFRRRPNERTAEVLRKLYRTVATSARVIQQDQRFIAEHPKGAEFGAVIADLGLHTPLRRPAVFGPVRRRKQSSRSKAEVTVLIPSYRHEAFIGKAIESVLAQTHTRLRVLVVDDCSPDETVAAARRIVDPRLEVRSNATNLGLGGSILGALASIDTPYVALLNSDDVFHPERLEKCVAILEKDPSAALVASRIAIMDDAERRLLPENSCVLDQGTAAHGWVRWYDRVTASLQPADWTSLPELLRHNHLATSSNLVCRTAFLREQAATIAPLKYCLDWSLFLHACIAGSLRFAPDALVGYRLHSSNTVWFDDVARPGYLHEVNAVVADAMHCHVARRRAEGTAPELVAEEVAGLLLGSVRDHGEADGMALFLAELTTGSENVPAAFRSPELVRMAQLALAARKPALAEAALRRKRIDHHAIEALVRRTRELEPQVGRLTQELQSARTEQEDAVVFRRRISEERAFVDAAKAEVVVATQEAAALQQLLNRTREDLTQAREAQARTSDELAASEARLATEQKELEAITVRLQATQAGNQQLETSLAARTARLAECEAELDVAMGQGRELALELQATRDELQATNAELQTTRDGLQALGAELQATRDELQATNAELQTTRDELQALGAELQATRDELQATSAELQTTRNELGSTTRDFLETRRILGSVENNLDATRSQLRDSNRQLDLTRRELAVANEKQRQASDAASRTLIEHRRELARLQQGIEFRLGRLLTHKLLLLGPLKTAARLWTGTRVGTGRLLRSLERWLPGRKPARVLFACDGEFPTADSSQIVGELLAVIDADFDARVLCWAAGSPRWLDQESQAALYNRVVLSRDAALLARDRRFFLRRNPNAVAKIDSFPAPATMLAPVFTFARSSQSLRAAYLQATGLGSSALAVWGANHLLGVHFGLRLEASDLATLRRPEWREVACAANALLVGSRQMEASVRAILGANTPSVLIIPSLVRHPAVTTQVRKNGHFLCIGPFADARGLLHLADAVKAALDRGVDLRFEVLGTGIDLATNLTAVDWFRGRLATLGILDRFQLRDRADLAQCKASLAGAMAVVEVQTNHAPEVPGPTPGMLAAMAAGLPIVAFRDGLGDAVRDGVEGRLAAPDDATALGNALIELAQDPELRAGMGAAGRQTYDARFAPGVAKAELCARIRALLNARVS
jgi:glycogen synthase